MHWNSLADFLAMGGYALYVWGSFGACALVMAAECLQLRLRRTELLEAVREQLAAQPSTEEHNA